MTICIFDEIVRLQTAGKRCALATIVNVEGSIPSFESAKMLVREDGSISGTIGGGGAEAEVIAAARNAMETERPQMVSFNLNKRPGIDAGMVCGGTLNVFVEPMIPVPTLYIFGAGHVGLETYKAARIAGFLVVVVDFRPEFANRDRFPDALDIITDEMDVALQKCNLNSSSFVFIVTPSHLTDSQVLKWAIDTPAKYIGMIGSRRKVAGIFKEFENEGVPETKLGHVFAPVGIDIGAQPPGEIAISVVAEMIACRRKCESALPHRRAGKADQLEVIEQQPSAIPA